MVTQQCSVVEAHLDTERLQTGHAGDRGQERAEDDNNDDEPVEWGALRAEIENDSYKICVDLSLA